jgi:hypothetical protein
MQGRSDAERWDGLFTVLAVVFLAAAAFHGAALIRPEIAEPVPAWWHALFVAVNAGLAFAVRRRPPWLPFVFAAYVVQQYVEHAPRGIAVWREEHRLDWASLGAVAFVPVVLVLLVIDARRRSAAARAAKA